MKNEKSIDVLNKLVEINNDRIAGYETALKETDENDLQMLFNQFITTSRKCKQELASEITRMGGEPEEGTRTDGKVYRAWMDVKAALTARDRKAILNSCEFGEDHAVDTYQEVMKDDLQHLTPEQHAMITNQYSQVKADHDKVRAMRDQLVDHD
ncbi:MAG: PA2169 family four-helix-bundle protein [Bacteroidota bacterium]|nr:PA2169 family four-helix-bundle protein [Bacteroidota bacterium]